MARDFNSLPRGEFASKLLRKSDILCWVNYHRLRLFSCFRQYFQNTHRIDHHLRLLYCFNHYSFSLLLYVVFIVLMLWFHQHLRVGGHQEAHHWIDLMDLQEDFKVGLVVLWLYLKKWRHRLRSAFVWNMALLRHANCTHKTFTRLHSKSVWSSNAALRIFCWMKGRTWKASLMQEYWFFFLLSDHLLIDLYKRRSWNWSQ